MPLIRYQDFNFRPDTRETIRRANEIIDSYAAQGYDLTLRQLYYQFVSRDLLHNTMQEYKRLGSIINDARLAGMIDWNRIEDRTRNLHSLPHWTTPGSVVRACANQFRVDKWGTQPFRVEVWIEKEALAGVFQRICDELDVPLFACRGYCSQSEMWAAGQRIAGYHRKDQKVKILHFGDHDPSGIDMTRDIKERLAMFARAWVDVERIALNMDQVEEYEPPPNPAKMTDSRAEDYVATYGDSSWELDALEPNVLADLVRTNVDSVCDQDIWKLAEETERDGRERLDEIATELDG